MDHKRTVYLIGLCGWVADRRSLVAGGRLSYNDRPTSCPCPFLLLCYVVRVTWPGTGCQSIETPAVLTPAPELPTTHLVDICSSRLRHHRVGTWPAWRHNSTAAAAAAAVTSTAQWTQGDSMNVCIRRGRKRAYTMHTNWKFTPVQTQTKMFINTLNSNAIEKGQNAVAT